MKILISILIIIMSILWGSMLMAQQEHYTALEFPGSYVKWINIAEQEFRKRNLDLSHYTVSILDKGESIIIFIVSIDAPKNAKGSGGTYPGYGVEINKNDSKIVSSSYAR